MLCGNFHIAVDGTVGFVSKLPHHLVESFKSTLEEILEADLIIHIVDANSPFRDLQISTTNEVLNSLGAYEIPTLMVLNKCDLVKNYITINNYPNSIQISAKLKEGLRELVSKIDETLFDEIYLDTFLIPFDKGNYISLIQETSEVISTEYLNEGTLIKAKVSKQIHNMLKEYMIEK